MSHVDEAGAPCFKVIPIEGKGLGAIAVRNIVCGELIVAEKPIMAYLRCDSEWDGVGLGPMGGDP